MNDSNQINLSINNESLFNEYDFASNSFDNDLELSLKQLKYLINCFTSPSSSNLNHATNSNISSSSTSNSLKNSTLDSTKSLSLTSSHESLQTSLNLQFNNLKELINYYHNVKTNSTKFIEYLIIKRLNYINNSFFNLNKKLCLKKIELINQTSSILDLLENYTKYDQIESNIQKIKSVRLKLILNSINLNNSSIFQTQLISNFKCFIYQFESVKKTISNEQLTKTNKKMNKFTIKKRSISADPRSNLFKSNRSRLESIDSKDKNSSDESDTDSNEPIKIFKLNDKCIKIDFIDLNHSNMKFLNHSIDLDSNTNKIIIILHKILRLDSNEQLNQPFLYESYEIDHNYCLNLIKSINLKPVNKTDLQQNGNVFKRMFKSKSKSSSRTNSQARDIYKSESKFEINSSSFFNLNLSLSNEFKHFINPTNLINLDLLDKWCSLWQIDILNEDLKFNVNERCLENNLNLMITPVFKEVQTNRRRSKFDQHQAKKSFNSNNNNNNENLNETEFFYFLKIKNDSNEILFKSSLFQNDSLYLNELCEIKIDNNLRFRIKIELFKFYSNLNLIKLVGNNILIIDRSLRKSCLSLNDLVSLKLKIFYKFDCQSSIDKLLIYNFDLNETNEFDLFNLNENFQPFGDSSYLIQKYLEFFIQIGLNNKKNHFRLNLLIKLFSKFLNIIEMNKIDLKLNYYQPKQILQFLISILRLIIDSESSEHLDTFRLTMKNFDLVIKLLVDLSIQSNSLYELKYSLNDLIIIKLAKQLKSNDMTKKALINENLNFKFLYHLNYNQLFNGNELAFMSLKLLNDLGEKNVLKVINTDLFSVNIEFRDRFVESLMIEKYLNINDTESVEIVKCLLKFKFKLSKFNMDNLSRIFFKFLISSLSSSSKLNNLIDKFLCLIDLIDFLILKSSYAHLDYLDDKELICLFDIIEHYFCLNQSMNINNQFKLCLNIDLIIFKFAKYVQKYLLRYLINKFDSENCISVFKSYFKMLFSFLKQKNFTYYSMFIKHSLVENLISFWKCLNINLKKSNQINECLLVDLLSCLINNFYYKSIKLDDMDMEYLNEPYLVDIDAVKMLNSNLIRFMNEIYCLNTFEINGFINFFMINLIELVLQNEKKIFKQLDVLNHQACDNSHFKTFSKLTFHIINTAFKHRLFLNDSNLNQVLNSFKICFDYQFLKESYELEVSIVEKYLFVYKLFKQVDSINERNYLFNTNLNTSKRKIKLYLLEDLYQLNKIEKNHLQMSFIRKQQADLFDWNYSNKNESDLKEILYLKSLKKFAINSLQEKYLLSQESVNHSKSEKDGLFNSIQFEICKQLCSYYEKLDENYTKFTRILNAETKFAQLAYKSLPNEKNLSQNQIGSIQHHQHGHLYFRIGIFGKSLKFDSIQNKHYLYKHKSYEMLSNIQNLIKNKLTYSKWSDNLNENMLQINHINLLHHNQEPCITIKESTDKCYIQICAVNKIDKLKLVDLLQEMIEQEDSFDYNLNEMKLKLEKYNTNSSFYYYDRPFYVRTNDINLKSNMTSSVIDDEEFEHVKEHESVENLWIERSILILDEFSSKYENLSQYEEIKSIFKLMLNPIRNAVSDINEKTKELKHFVVQFTSNNSNKSNINIIHSLQPLTMRLLGCLDARVNGGLIKYVKELLNEKFMGKNKLKLLNQLYLSIKDQLNVLESGLSIHDRILKDVEFKFKDLDTSDNSYEHIKHMNELNMHLIDCLRLIENELNERWSKFS